MGCAFLIFGWVVYLISPFLGFVHPLLIIYIYIFFLKAQDIIYIVLRKSSLNMGTVPSQTIRPYRKKPPIKPKPQPDEHPAKPDHTKRNPTLNLITATRQTAIPIYPASPGQKH